MMNQRASKQEDRNSNITKAIHTLQSTQITKPCESFLPLLLQFIKIQQLHFSFHHCCLISYENSADRIMCYTILFIVT
uniref:Uncharacterized protein n=1 Tax=Rhizophora mucronata TaxID=61149 RepID=A0A2P2PX09_RHIMU